MKTLILILFITASFSAQAQNGGGDVGDHGIHCVVEAQSLVNTLGLKTVFKNGFNDEGYLFRWDSYSWRTSLIRTESIPGLGNPKNLDPRLLAYHPKGWELITDEIGEAALRSIQESDSHSITAPDHVRNLKANLFLGTTAESEVTSKLGIRSELTRYYLVLKNRDGKILDRIQYWKTNPWVREGVSVQFGIYDQPKRSEILRLIKRNLDHCE